MKKKINAYCLIALSILILGGCAKIYTAQGDKNFEQLVYPKAAKNYEKALAKKANDVTQKKLANTYRLMNDTKKGLDAYTKVVSQNNAEATDFLYLAQMQMANKKYADASVTLQGYLKNNATDKTAQNMLYAAEHPDEFMKDTTKWGVSKAKIGNVSEFYGPVKYKNGIVFTANLDGKGKDKVSQTGKSYYKLYYTAKDKSGSYSTPEKLTGNINVNKLHAASASYSNGGGAVFYTTSNTDGMKKSELTEKLIGLKISRDTIINGTYTKTDDLPFNSKEYSTGHPAMDANGKNLYFVSDMPGGLGGTDIYETHLENGVWSKPENLGDKINTSGNELYPFMDSLGNFYFSSNGRVGMGGLDVYQTKKDGKSWKESTNLNYPLNTSKDDFGMMMNADGKIGYISSNREGTDKIYEFILQAAKVSLAGKVVSKTDGTPLAGAKIEIRDKARNTTDTIYTAADGTYSYMLAPNTDFDVSVSKDGYFSQSEDVTTVNVSAPINKDFSLEVLKEGVPVVIDEPNSTSGVRPIFYDFDKSEIRPDAFESLDKLVKKLKANPKVTIELSSHTDCKGTSNYNQDLSFKRAKSAKIYLESKGVKASRIKTKGYGESQPINKCVDGVTCTEEEYQANRRTEFKVIEIEK